MSGGAAGISGNDGASLATGAPFPSSDAPGGGRADDDLPSGLLRLPKVQGTPASARRQRRAVAGIIVGFTLLVGVCLTAGLLAWKSNEATRAVIGSLEIRRASYAAYEAMLEAESAQRAYLLTQDDSFLPDYEEAAKLFGERVKRLLAATGPDTRRNAVVRELARHAEEKVTELDSTIALNRAGRRAEALALVQSGIGRKTTQQTQDTLDQLTLLLNHEIDTNTPWQATLSKVLLFTIGIAALCVTVLSVIVFRDTRRNLRFLEARENALRTLAMTLEQRVERRTRSLSLVNQRFNAALGAAKVTVFTQDRDLRFTWVSTTDADLKPDQVTGHAEHEVVPADVSDALIAFKNRVLETGAPDQTEVRIQRGDSEKWFDVSVRALRDHAGVIEGLIGATVDITARKQQEAQIRLLMREVTHRSKNLLSVIQAIMRQTAANASSTADFQKRFADRLHSLAGSHDLLVLENWNGASMRDLVHSQLGHYSDLVGSQIALSGPPIQIGPDAAQHIGMALHELATNAAKYGALSTPEGLVRISWTTPGPDDPDTMCHLLWEEERGPPVTPPTRRGFGRVVIERTVARAVDGEVHITYPVSGVRWELRFPRSVLV